jgi:RNA-directed DNA polymerase
MGHFSETTQGTPQGGVISPMLCNVALNGIQNEVEQGGCFAAAELVKVKRGQEKNKVHMVRYADDFIITAKSQDLLENYVAPLLKSSLSKRGLELNPNKTRILNINQGFDFLGFTIRRMPFNYKLNDDRGERQQDTVRSLIIKPTKEAFKRVKSKIKKLVQSNKPIESIIRDLNPVLRG